MSHTMYHVEEELVILVTNEIILKLLVLGENSNDLLHGPRKPRT